MDTDDFATIKSVHMAHYPNALTVASLLFGASDSRFFRSKGIPCYGVCPMLVSLEEFNRIHGIDERVSVDSMLEGIQVYTDMVKKLCRT
jgi:carboxypeptidase PM20D1